MSTGGPELGETLWSVTSAVNVLVTSARNEDGDNPSARNEDGDNPPGGVLLDPYERADGFCKSVDIAMGARLPWAQDIHFILAIKTKQTTRGDPVLAGKIVLSNVYKQYLHAMTDQTMAVYATWRDLRDFVYDVLRKHNTHKNEKARVVLSTILLFADYHAAFGPDRVTDKLKARQGKVYHGAIVDVSDHLHTLHKSPEAFAEAVAWCIALDNGYGFGCRAAHKPMAAPAEDADPPAVMQTAQLYKRL